MIPTRHITPAAVVTLAVTGLHPEERDRLSVTSDLNLFDLVATGLAFLASWRCVLFAVLLISETRNCEFYCTYRRVDFVSTFPFREIYHLDVWRVELSRRVAGIFAWIPRSYNMRYGNGI